MKATKTVAVALLGVLGVVAATPALAVNPIRFNDYYEEKLAETPTLADSLSRTYVTDAFPSDKYTTITQVSCYLESTQPLRGGFLSVAASPTDTNIRRINFETPFTITNGKYFYSFAEPVEFMVGPGRYARVTLSTAVASTFSGAPCVLTGRINNY